MYIFFYILKVNARAARFRDHQKIKQFIIKIFQTVSKFKFNYSKSSHLPT